MGFPAGVRGREELVAVLRARGILAQRAIARAFETVDLEAFLPPEFRPLAYANTSIPFHPQFRGAILPSPLVLAALLQHLELEADLDVGIAGAFGGYPAALVAAATAKGRVVVAEVDARLRELAATNLQRMGLEDRVTVRDDFGDVLLDRILILDPGQRPLGDLTSSLRDMGFAIARNDAPDQVAVRKTIRTHEKDLDLTMTDIPVQPAASGKPAPPNWARLVTREDLLTHAWEDRVVGHHDAHFAEGIEDTLSGGPLDPRVHELTLPQVAARRAFHGGYILQCLGELDDAEDLYLRSIALFPTAEAHTFLGWTYSFAGDPERAIEECRRAIDTDPTFGNPYNDIGAYLIELGRLDEAIPWLKRALESARYCCYFYAHTNLARVYVLRGQTHFARKHLEEALKVKPDYEPASEMLRRLSRETDYVA